MVLKRQNLRKTVAVGGVLVLLWITVSVVLFPKTEPAIKSFEELESRLEKLQEKLELQLAESDTILDRAKEQLSELPRESHRQIVGTKESSHELPLSKPVLPVLVISCDRPTVRRCLDSLLKFRPNKEQFPIIVSQDCGHNETYQVIKSYADADPSITVVRQPDLSEIKVPKVKVKFRGYYKIARHFKFALHHVLDDLRHEAVIIVEDDLDISPDFFEYFQGTYPLLLKDPSLWCISAWNDNGKKDLIDPSRPELLHRTDFFPGLGWLLRRETWLELEPIWPEAFFDDWLRNPENTKGRACIRPEISRTYSFGKVGVSKGLFFDMHLRYIQLNMDFVEFTKLDLSYLLKDRYDADLSRLVSTLPVVPAGAVGAAAGDAGSHVRVLYSDAKSFKEAAKAIGLMDDFRSGVPRTAYRGVVTCHTHGRRVYLAPGFEWTKYDRSWG